MDYYVLTLQIAGVGTLLSGINLIVTIIKMRAPGMNLMKMPIFTWTALCTNVPVVAAFPVLTAVLGCWRWTATSAPASSPTTSAAIR